MQTYTPPDEHHRENKAKSLGSQESVQVLDPVRWFQFPEVSHKEMMSARRAGTTAHTRAFRYDLEDRTRDTSGIGLEDSRGVARRVLTTKVGTGRDPEGGRDPGIDDVRRGHASTD